MGHFPFPLAVDSLVPLAVVVGGLLLEKEGTVGRKIGCVLDPFQEEDDDVSVRVVDDNKRQTAEMVDTAAVYTGEILHLGQTADQAIMVGKGHCCTHTWAELVVVQDSTCNVDFAVDWCSMMGQRVGLVAGIDFVPVYIVK